LKECREILSEKRKSGFGWSTVPASRSAGEEKKEEKAAVAWQKKKKMWNLGRMTRTGRKAPSHSGWGGGGGSAAKERKKGLEKPIRKRG